MPTSPSCAFIVATGIGGSMTEAVLLFGGGGGGGGGCGGGGGGGGCGDDGGCASEELPAPLVDATDSAVKVEANCMLKFEG